MNLWRSFVPVLVFLILQILIGKVKMGHAIEDENADENVDAIDTRDIEEQVENKGEDVVSTSQSDPTGWRNWGHHGWNYRRPSYQSMYNRRRPRPYHRPIRYRPQHHTYRQHHLPFGYRQTFRFRRPIVRPMTTPTQPPTTMPAPCHEGVTSEDKCGRVCVCRGGKLTDCYRVRREFSHMSKEEKQRYINTVLTVSTTEPYKSKYETLLTNHKQFFRLEIHQPAYFLPWHRWFLLQYENLLREVNCRVTVPYWDWSLVSGTPFKNDFWNDTNGFGGDGVGFPSCVRTGPFSVGSNWKVIRSAGGGCLQRNFFVIPGTVPDVVALARLLAKKLSSFSDFELMLRINMHDVIHFAIGGTMITEDSAAAPEFFAHHSYVDKLWNDWQAKSNLHRYHNFFLTRNTKMPGTQLMSVDLLNNNGLPGCVKVRYAKPELGKWDKLIEDVKEMAETNPKQLEMIPRMRTGKLSETMFEVFRVTKEERRRAREMQREIEPKYKVDATKLKGMEKMMGLKATDIKRIKTTV